jgi:hypothetical protein
MAVAGAETLRHTELYPPRFCPYTFNVTLFTRIRKFLAVLCLLHAGFLSAAAQEPAAKPAEKPEAKQKPAEKPALPFQIQLLETRVRFEANGDSRKEVHTVVKLNNILGAREFARLAFDYNRAFQQLEIPQVRITHANGGTSEVLPSAITDAPNPAVEKFPAYQDVRVKSVRLLGLQEGDTIEYRVTTTTTHHPLAPDFWLEHTFDRSGQVMKEQYELVLPASRRELQVRINPDSPPVSRETSGSGQSADITYRWTKTYSAPRDAGSGTEPPTDAPGAADIGISTLSWEFLAIRLAESMLPGSRPILGLPSYEGSMKELDRQPEVSATVREKMLSLTTDSKTQLDRLKAIYDFVSREVVSVDLPLGATGFRARPASEILKSAYATAEDSYVLFAALAAAANLRVVPALTGFCDRKALATPSVFKRLLVIGYIKERPYWLDPVLEVAPFGMLSPASGKCALLLRRETVVLSSTEHEWAGIPYALPFAASQKVRVDATLGENGDLSAKVKYTMRGDNELLLRGAFHQTPKEKWKDVASLLALSDGFRGQVTSVNASDPMATKEPFTVEYELAQSKFVDWSKKPVRIPALLPQIGLPEPPRKLAEDGKASNIELGTPLNVETQLMLHLPAGTTVQAPAGTSVARNYAIYVSKYSVTAETLTASRHINFLLREVSAERSVDYSAFLHAVQNDQAQQITLVPAVDSGKDIKH